MARRRRNRDVDIFESLFALVALVFFLSMFNPAVRQALVAVGYLVLALVGLALAGGVGSLIYRFRKQRQQEADAAPLKVFNLNRIEPQVSVSPLSSPVKLKVEVPPPVREQAKLDFLEQLKNIDWFQFEKIVALVYEKLGYAVTRRGGANPDGGIDLIIRKDGQTAAVQCKQWKTWNVGVRAVREFLGALTHEGIQKGIFITMRGYTGEAKQLAQEHGIEIVNETDLARMLESTDARFDPKTRDILSDQRKFCPKCEREMVLRTAGKGKGVGQKFWGCSGYPKCHYTMQA